MITLEQGRKQFIDHLKTLKRSSSTILAYGKDIEQLVQFLQNLGKQNAEDVALEDLQKFMEKFSKEGYLAKSVSRKTNSTKTFFKFLRSSGEINDDPATGLEHPKFENKPPRILSKVEYRALRDAAKADKRIFAIIELLLQTGIRIGELSKLRKEDINLEGANLHVPVFEGTRERNIPLNQAGIDAVKNYLEIRPKSQSQSLFITKTGKPLLIRNIRSAIDRYFKAGGIEGTKVNDLRHTWVAHQLQAGASLVVVSKLAGHKRLSTTEKYLQFVQGQNGVSKVKLEEL